MFDAARTDIADAMRRHGYQAGGVPCMYHLRGAHADFGSFLAAMRPGYALSLALGDGADAIEALEEFWTAVHAGRDVSTLAQRLAGRETEGVFAYFQAMLSARLAADAKQLAKSGDARAHALVSLRESIDTLLARGEAVNLDRAQMLTAAARAFQSAAR